jgi:uncharacterized membrane protein
MDTDRERAPMKVLEREPTVEPSPVSVPVRATRLGKFETSEAGWVLVCLAVLAGGITSWSTAPSWGWALPLSLLVDVCALGIFVLVVAQRRCPGWAQLVLLGAVAVVVSLQVARAIAGNPAYGTDEAAFNQYAATLLLHGQDPYIRSMLPALSKFGVADGARTYFVSGKVVGTYSYPALGFLPVALLLAFGLHTQTPIVLSAGAWILTIVVCWAMLPRAVRFCAPLVGLGALALGYVSSGLNDPVELPLLLVALWRWDRYLDGGGTAWRRAAGPIALGLACAVKPTPWFVVPFLVVAIALEARSHGRSALRAVGSYVCWAAVGFVVPNLAFLAWDPSAWWHGVLFPLVQPTVAGGQGFVSILLAHGGGPLGLLDVAALLVLLAGLCALAAFYHSLRGALVGLVAVVLFIPARSFGSYLIFLAPAALVAACTLGEARQLPKLHSRIRLALVGTGSLALIAECAAIVLSLLPPAVSMDVGRTEEAGGSVSAVNVEVSNHSASWITPRFVVSNGGVLGADWVVAHGPRHIAPYTSADLELDAPDVTTMPLAGRPLVVDAFFGDRVAAYRSAAAGPWQLALEPQVVQPSRPLRTLVMRVQLEGEWGEPLHRAGARVALTQVAYGKLGAYPAEVEIDGHAQGQSPVYSRTNRNGSATFVVEALHPQRGPVFFEGWLIGDGSTRTHSNAILVYFRNARR